MAGSISAQAQTNARVWAWNVGIPRERIDRIMAESVADGVAWTVDASPTADANLIAHLRVMFNREGLPNEWADRFIAQANALGPASQLLNGLATMVDITGITVSAIDRKIIDLGYAVGTRTDSAVAGGFTDQQVKAQAIAAAHQDIVGTAANYTVYVAP